MATLYEALTGYPEPGAGAVDVPVILGENVAPPPDGASDEEPREAEFQAILADLRARAELDPAFAQKLADAFRVPPDPEFLKREIEKSQELVAQAQPLLAEGVPSDATVLDAQSTAETPQLLAIPADFTDSYLRDHVVPRLWRDLPPLDLDPTLRRFEDDNTVGILGWLVFNGLDAVKVPRSLKAPFAEQFRRIAGAAPFVQHQRLDDFVHQIPPAPGPDPVRLALFADFGTGLAHSRLIARQITLNDPPFDAAVHLGDVYYTGTSKQYREYFEEPLEAVLVSDTKLFVIPDNHDGYSGFHAYVDFMRRRAPHQRASYFAIETPRVQLIGVDTIWHSDRGRIQDAAVREWLQARFAAGRAAGRANILLTGHEPYEYKKMDLTALNQDVLSLAGGALDLWFWGNTHYCALFDRGPNTPYYGSCIGHGGYPYGRQPRAADAPLSAAPVLFVESGSRYEGSTVRSDRGMNGFCSLEIGADGTVVLQYRDWRGHERCLVTFTQQPDGGLGAPVVQDRIV